MLQLFRDSDSSRASVKSISEFLLTQPCLSFAISDTSVKRVDASGNLTTGQFCAQFIACQVLMALCI